jgi:hypothetical protein
MLLTAVHCLPGGMDENKRNCMVRFSSLMNRDEVLQKDIALKSGYGYSVVPLVWLLNNENIDILCDLCFFFW